MSGTLVEIKFAVIVNDPQNWSRENLARAHADETSGAYSECAADRLRRAMEAAGRKFIR